VDSLNALLAEKLRVLADDEVVLAQRLSEWVSYAPILEEDIAIANLAQDELGHAQVYLELKRALDGVDPDREVFFKDPLEFRNAVLVELPRGDWAYTMVRQYLFDLYESLWLQEAQGSAYPPLAEAAARLYKEERFHLKHASTWVERLALGTEESHARTAKALEELWPYARQLFRPLEGEAALVEVGYVPDLEALWPEYEERARGFLQGLGLFLPEKGYVPKSRSEHTEHLWPLVVLMQSVARWDPEAQAW
jgi:ring-1,2-phenylacetyl-CoA epoxidase subunit PaaC